MSFRIVELIAYLPGGDGILGGSAKPDPGRRASRRPPFESELFRTAADPLPHALVQVVARAHGQDTHRDIHGDDDATVRSVLVVGDAAVRLGPCPQRALFRGLVRPESAVIPG